MALVTTIGSASADSYGTLAAYEAYVVANISLNFNGHGHDSTHEMHLRRAAQWIDRRFHFVGIRQYETQALSWPRLYRGLVKDWPIDPDSIPQDIISAQFELAYLFEEQSLDPFATITERRTRSTIGPISVETIPTGQPRIVAVEGLLAPYTVTGSGQMAAVRG
mgnify:CR=1 FL=1